jgi:hypothetical protein
MIEGLREEVYEVLLGQGIRVLVETLKGVG